MLLKLIILAIIATQCFAGIPKIIGKARPCAMRDYRCIRANFAANSKCNPRTRPVQNHFWVKRHRFEAPHFNSSYIDNNMVISGMQRCYVSEYFYNVNKDTGVLGVDCPGLTFSSNRVVLQHTPYQEDGVYSYKYNGTYPMIRMTMSLDGADVLDICKEFTSIYIDQLPTFHIDPNDLPTKNFLTRDLTELNIYERESFFYRANLLVRHFINTQLCDFGCD